MTTLTLYIQALANREQTGKRYGVARHILATGETIICSVSPVAGRSIVAKHDRTEYGIIRPGQQYAKPIGRKALAALLRDAGL